MSPPLGSNPSPSANMILTVLKRDEAGHPTVVVWRKTEEEKASRISVLQEQKLRGQQVRKSINACH